MGLVPSHDLSILPDQENFKFLLVGLEGAGKTSLLYRMRLGEIITESPVEGCEIETVDYKNVNFTVWDLGKPAHFRTQWQNYFYNAKAIVFVIDSANKDRIEALKEDFNWMLNQDSLHDVPVLVLANKYDLPDLMSVGEICDKLQLRDISGRPWNIQCTNSITGDGFNEALDWLVTCVRDRAHR